MFHVPEKNRINEITTPAGTFQTELGNNGFFMVSFDSYNLMVIASDGEDWEHVSVSLKNRTPNWREMNFIKDLFWDPEDCVMQLHPPKSEYVNNHPYCLHLWRPIKEKIPTPPYYLVGIK